MSEAVASNPKHLHPTFIPRAVHLQPHVLCRSRHGKGWEILPRYTHQHTVSNLSSNLERNIKKLLVTHPYHPYLGLEIQSRLSWHTHIFLFFKLYHAAPIFSETGTLVHAVPVPLKLQHNVTTTLPGLWLHGLLDNDFYHWTKTIKLAKNETELKVYFKGGVKRAKN